MANENERLENLLDRDQRFHRGAYEFIFHGLGYTVDLLQKRDAKEEQAHVSGQQLLDGLRRLALQEFGFLARSVWGAWGITRTDDWGEIVYNLIGAELMNKTDDDSLDDFQNAYDLDDALEACYFRDRLYDCPKDENGRVEFPWPTPPNRTPPKKKPTTPGESSSAAATDIAASPPPAPLRPPPPPPTPHDHPPSSAEDQA